MAWGSKRVAGTSKPKGVSHTQGKVQQIQHHNKPAKTGGTHRKHSAKTTGSHRKSVKNAR